MEKIDYLDIHADDYAYSLNTSRDILDCIKTGNLNSISIICNTVHFEESMELLYKSIPSFKYLPLMSVHLNFPEGFGVSDLLPISWGKLFLKSYSFSKRETKDMLKQEIKYQIDRTQEAIEKCIDIAIENNIPVYQRGIRIDSHIHTHLIPVVWDALIETIDEERYHVEYIRNPKEPIFPFLKQISLLSSYGIVNFIKNRILMFYSKKADDYCNSHKIDKMYMWGLMMSSHMDYDRIKKIYPDFLEYARKRGRRLVLLFHPGQASKDEYSKEMDENYFRDANLSENRRIEKDSVLRIKDIIE